MIISPLRASEARYRRRYTGRGKKRLVKMEKWLEENKVKGARSSPGRYSVETTYSYAYQLDFDTIENMAEDAIVKSKVPLPDYVKEAFKIVAHGDAEDLKQFFSRHNENDLLFCVNQVGMTLLEVARERGHISCVQFLQRRTIMKIKEQLPEEKAEDSLTSWLRDHNLDIELREPLSEIAADVSDLAEMTNEDIETLFIAHQHLKPTNEALLRSALYSIGALRPSLSLAPPTTDQHTPKVRNSCHSQREKIPPPITKEKEMQSSRERIRPASPSSPLLIGNYLDIFVCCGAEDAMAADRPMYHPEEKHL